jgi:shikimate kinase
MRQRVHIILIGLTGSGKTTLGAELAKRLGRPFFDIDSEIVRVTGQSVDALFATRGEQGFRIIEAKVLKQHCSNENPSVIATGGGVVLDQQNIRTMRCSGNIIRILRKPELILSTLDVEGRPLLAKNPEKIHGMARERERFYRQAADFSVQNEDIPLKTLEEMMMISESIGLHRRIMIINGPNLNRLGTRELENLAKALSVKLEIRQSNHEGDLVDWIQEAGDSFDGILINPAAYMHTSIALLDGMVSILRE